ncbi:unnamed protein product, partial [Coregonus sp. 'balchen']
MIECLTVKWSRLVSVQIHCGKRAPFPRQTLNCCRCPYNPFYLTVVYIHSKANTANASDITFYISKKQDFISPEAPKLIIRDFNIVPTKTNKIIPNSKPWVSKKLKVVLNKKVSTCRGELKPWPPQGQSAPHKGKGKSSAALEDGEGLNMANDLNVFFSKLELDYPLSGVRQ